MDKHFTYDSFKRIQAEIFYNNLGLTGQINRIYFNQTKKLNSGRSMTKRHINNIECV